MTEALFILCVVVATALAFDFTNGFHDTANAMASSIATGALKPKAAVTLSAILNLVGAFLSIEVALTVTNKVISIQGANGAPDFPDPERKDGGVGMRSPKSLDTPDGKKALAACRDKNPQNDTDDSGGNVDSAKLADWTKCMRAKLPNFPDPEVTGNTITLQLSGTGINGGSADFQNAQKVCESHFPGGNLRSMGGSS